MTCKIGTNGTEVIDNLNFYFCRDTRSEEFGCSLARLERLFDSNVYFMKELSLRVLDENALGRRFTDSNHVEWSQRFRTVLQ